MIDHDEMKTGLLHDLISKLMEMKDPSEHGEHEASPEHEHMLAKDTEHEDVGDDHAETNEEEGHLDSPHQKLSMPEMHEPSEGSDDAEDRADEGDMKKPLMPHDFLSMKKKHLGM